MDDNPSAGSKLKVTLVPFRLYGGHTRVIEASKLEIVGTRLQYQVTLVDGSREVIDADDFEMVLIEPSA
jgi:hypothetical protein